MILMKKLVSISALSLCLAAAGWLGLRLVSGGRNGGAPAQATPSSPGIPVMADLAGYAEVPIYLSGLGTVQAFNSVLIKSRVDGQILKMDFAEGRSFSDGFAGRQIRSQGAPRARLRRCCRRASPERRVVLGSANSPSQSGDVDAVARAVVGALLDVTRHAHVALDRSLWVSTPSATSTGDRNRARAASPIR
jgi:hypothetical protein